MKQRKFRFDIFIRTALFISLIAFIPSVVIGTIGLTIFKRDIIAEKYTTMHNSLYEKEMTLDYLLDQVKLHAFSMSKNRDAEIMLSILKQGEQETRQEEYNQAKVRTLKYLKEQVDYSDGLFENLFFIDTNGVNIADGIDGISVGNSELDREFYQKGITGIQILCDLVISPVNGRSVVAIGTPIFNDAGEVIGVFASPMDFLNLTSSIVLKRDDKYTAKYEIYDKNGIVIAATDANLIGRDVNADFEEAKFFDYIKSNKKGDNSKQNSDVCLAFINFEEKEWYLVTYDQRSALLSPVNTFTNYLLITLGSILIFVVVASVIYSRSLAIKSEENRKILFESNPQVSTIWTKNLMLVDCNPAALKFYQVETQSLLTSAYKASFPELQQYGANSVKVFDAYLKKALEDGRAEFDFVQKLGDKLIPLNIIAKKIKYHDEVAVAVFQYDLTKLTEAQNTLIERDKLLETVNNIAEILLTTDTTDISQSINKSLAIFANAVETDKISIWMKNVDADNKIHCTQIDAWYSDIEYNYHKAVSHIIIDESAPLWQQQLLKGKNYKGIFEESDEYFKFKHDVLSILVEPININHEFWGFIVINDFNNKREYSDIEISMLNTAGNLIASAIMKSNMTEDLINTREKALSSAKSKSDFLSRMSHEIRTPMNAIIGMTKIAMKTDEKEKIMNSLTKIDVASNHLLDIINNILDMAKIDANKYELSEEAFSFSKLIDNINSVINVRSEEKQQDLKIVLDDKIPDSLYGDRVIISEVLTNLLTNAIKFTPNKGKVTLSATLKERIDDDCVIEFKVADNGIGISKEQQEKLFSLFEQADGGINRKYGGTGLGLFISKKFVEMMGGEIWINSELNKGSEFIFNIKIKTYSEKDASKNEPETAVEMNLMFENKYILIAEDVEINAEILMAILEETKINIDVAENGLIAIEKFTSSPEKYDLILMDIHMPECDGYEATRRIRALNIDQAKSIPILAMTANAFKEDIEKCLECGMNSHLAKPVDFDKLIQELNKYLFKK